MDEIVKQMSEWEPIHTDTAHGECAACWRLDFEGAAPWPKIPLMHDVNLADQRLDRLQKMSRTIERRMLDAHSTLADAIERLNDYKD